MNPENALVSRQVIESDADRVVIEEIWDTGHPDSPWVPVPWIPAPLKVVPNPLVRQVLMSSREFWAWKIPLKTPAYERPNSPDPARAP